MALPWILAEIGAASRVAVLLRFVFRIFAEAWQPGLWRNLPWCKPRDGATFSGRVCDSLTREGLMSFTKFSCFGASSFSIFQRSMMQNDELPLVDAIDDARFEEAFDEHQVDFGNDEDAVSTSAITLWALVSQVFFANEQRSCKAAVLRVAALWAVLGRRVCDTNTGAYCRARLKIPYEVVRDITKRLAADAEEAVDQDAVQTEEEAESALSPEVVANVKSRAAHGRILLVDGFTITAADTPENQEEYPQHSAQSDGVGFPILRCVSLISMTTGRLLDLACGPYSGKETGETAWLLQLLDTLQPGDVLVADSYYCSYWLVAACQSRGVQVVMKNHHKRDDHPAGARRLNQRERLVVWDRPQRPDGMSPEQYADQPKTIEIRLVDIQVKQAGFRPAAFTIATTITDRKVYSAAWIGSVYQSRWLVELDIRSIKCSLGMDILRAKTPAMVRTELWSCLLAYNLIRLKMLQSCATSGRDPRSLSFTTTLQLLGTNWLLCAVIGATPELSNLGQAASSSERVGHRPGRIEPRKNKRRPKLIALMTKPRDQCRAELGAAA